MKLTAKVLGVCLLILGSVFSLPATASAQTYTATVTGTVTDPNGASVPNVKVTAINQGTKLEYNAHTNDSGLYSIPFLPAGNYVLVTEVTGFKKLISNEITFEVNQIARVDLKLQVGTVDEQVTVSGVAPILQTENVTVGNVITGNTTTNLPLNGRNFQQLTLLVPGTINPNPGGFTGVGQGAQGRPYVNGNREQGNAFLLDGISVDETIDNRIGYKPNVDAIAEFRVETSNSSAEFGNVTGATVNATLKSGTNDFHGNAFEFLRNDAIDAQTWGNNRAGVTTKPKLRQNIFGGTLGGPIIKNKLFFFGDYQGIIQRTGGGGSVRVAPLAWRQGNLSTLSSFIRDPQRPRSQLCQANPANPTPGVNYQEACFPGSIIPANRIVNPVAKALFADTSLYPLPSRIDATNGTGILDVVTAARVNSHQFDVKIDARLTSKDNLSGRYSFANYQQAANQGSLPVTPTSSQFSRPQNFVLNWTRTISPTIINEARVGLNRAVFITNNAFDWAGIGDGNQKLGIPGGQAAPGVTSVALGSGLSNIGAVGTNEDNVTNTFHFGDNLTLLRGRHTFKVGGQLQRYQQNRYYAGNNGVLGLFVYDTQYTGVAFADFLLDQLTRKGLGGVSGTNKGTWGHRQNRIGLFIQDDFKARNNLTLNIGMRWEYTSPVYEVKDRQLNFELFSGRQLFAGRDGNSRALYEPFHKGFEPRIGIAWTPERFNNKLVVRAGYGITQYMEGTGSNLRLPLNPPFFSEADVSYDIVSGPGTIARGFTDVIVRDRPAGLIRVWDPDLRPQFTQQWNLALEYQPTGTMSLSAAYVGHNATHLVAPTDWNQPLPGTGDPATWIPFQRRRPLFSVLPDVTQISGTGSWSVSRYHALQVNARQRYARGFEYLLSYTYSKTMTDNLGYYGSGGVSAQGAYSGNHYDQRGYNYGPAFFDATHNFVWAGTYELPFGKGRAWGSNLQPVVNAFLGGWGISSIVSLHSGFPITIAGPAGRTLQDPRGTVRPNQIGNPTITSNPDCYIYNPLNGACSGVTGTVAFSEAAIGTFGSAGVGTVRAPGYFNWDFGVGKKFYLTERHYIDFRAEFFNFSNTPSFNPPDRTFTPTSRTFGQITGTVSPPRIIEFALKYHF
ncbi:MAG: TonB-dependent receptor [Acidobacteria bacterium]|nr:TonB-dependent receptor [Acidobacteriota bacterium]